MKKRKGFIDIIKRVLLYLSRKYDVMQKNEIIKGENKGLDISPYQNSNFDWKQMREIRLGLEKDLDITTYAKPEFSVDQMEEIRLGLEKRLDVSYYNKPEFDWKQMREIRNGLEKGLDVSTYAKSELDIDQMEEIKIGLEKGLDVSYYNKSSFNWEQMRQIRIGLERNIDITVYAKPEINFEEMEVMRNKAQENNLYNRQTDKINNNSIQVQKELQETEKSKEIKNSQGAKSIIKSKDFIFSKYDANVIFPVIKRTPTIEAIQERILQRYRNEKEALEQIKIFKGRIEKLVQHGYLKNLNGKYEITPKGENAVKEVNTAFEFTSYDATVVFGYINKANGYLTLDNLMEQLNNQYSTEYAEKQFEYVKRRLEDNFSNGYLVKNDNGAYSISELGAMKAEEITSSSETYQELEQETDY